MAVAETRKGPLGVLNIREAVDRDVMLNAYTIQAARVLLMDKKIGSIEPGKQADFILVDRDVRTIDPGSLKGTQVL